MINSWGVSHATGGEEEDGAWTGLLVTEDIRDEADGVRLGDELGFSDDVDDKPEVDDTDADANAELDKVADDRELDAVVDAEADELEDDEVTVGTLLDTGEDVELDWTEVWLDFEDDVLR